MNDTVKRLYDALQQVRLDIQDAAETNTVWEEIENAISALEKEEFKVEVDGVLLARADEGGIRRELILLLQDPTNETGDYSERVWQSTIGLADWPVVSKAIDARHKWLDGVPRDVVLEEYYRS